MTPALAQWNPQGQQGNTGYQKNSCEASWHEGTKFKWPSFTSPLHSTIVSLFYNFLYCHAFFKKTQKSMNLERWQKTKQDRTVCIVLCLCILQQRRVLKHAVHCVITSCWEFLLLGHVSWLCLIVQCECSQLIVSTVLFWNPQLAASGHCDTCFHLSVRFRSVHCLLHPDTTWCLGSQQVWRLPEEVGRLMDGGDKPAFTALWEPHSTFRTNILL